VACRPSNGSGVGAAVRRPFVVGRDMAGGVDLERLTAADVIEFVVG
jgi:hypothetical protein